MEHESNDSESISDISEDKYNHSVHRSVKPRSRKDSRRLSIRSLKSLRRSVSRASSCGSVASSEKSQTNHPWDKVFSKRVNTSI